MNKALDLAKKLKELSDRGIGGEKTTASAMLRKLMDKHKISIEEIDGEEKNDYYFKVGNCHKLLFQIIKHVNYEIPVYKFPPKAVKQYSLKGNLMISCTASEYIEIEAKNDFYSKLFKQEEDLFFTAFLDANDLLVINPNKIENKDEDSEEYQKQLRIYQMAKSIKKGEFRKQISNI